jgi:hypothetical protein
MVTSWDWIYLTDFASYKPVCIPEVLRDGQWRESERERERERERADKTIII